MQVAAEPSLITNISADGGRGSCLLPGPPAGLMVSTSFPLGGSVGFLLDVERRRRRRRTLPGVAAALSCKPGNRPCGDGKPLQQPAGVTPSRRRLHNQTDSNSPADAGVAPPPRSHPLPVTAVSTPKMPSHVQHRFQIRILCFFFPFRFFSNAQTNAARKQRNVMKF